MKGFSVSIEERSQSVPALGARVEVGHNSAQNLVLNLIDSKPLTLNPKLQTLTLKALDPRPLTLNPKI